MTFKHTELGTITDECYADLKLAKQLNWLVMEQRASIGGGCQNCGGQGFHHLGFAPGSSGKDKSRATWYDAGKMVTVESRVYPCPVCSSQNAFERAEVLWGMSGLEVTEYKFSLDFLKGKGKDAALTDAYALMSQAPTPRGWATFFGGYGVGKSGILKSLTAAFVKTGVQAHYCRANDMLIQIQDTFGGGPGQQEKIMAQYRGYTFLAIDEVDRIGESQWSNSTLMLILDDRYNNRNRVATAIATNQHPDKLPDRFAYLSSRMADGLRVLVAGETLRGN